MRWGERDEYPSASIPYHEAREFSGALYSLEIIVKISAAMGTTNRNHGVTPEYSIKEEEKTETTPECEIFVVEEIM